MRTYLFPTERIFRHNWTGKFVAPTPEWIHLTRDLTDFELFVVTEGTLYIANDKSEYVVEKGQFLIMAPNGYQHGYKPSNCTFYWMHFTPSFSEGDTELNYRYEDVADNAPSYMPNFISIPENGTLTAYDRLVVLMKQLQDSDKRYHEQHLNDFITSAVLCEIMNQMSTFHKYASADNKNQLYNDIIDYISWHVCENIKINELADYFGYNDKYLSTFFRRMSGIPLKQHILQAKMDHAKAELSDTNRSISQIAYNIGFSDSHNFSNAFKKITGLTPSEYRISYSKRQLFYS